MGAWVADAARKKKLGIIEATNIIASGNIVGLSYPRELPTI